VPVSGKRRNSDVLLAVNVAVPAFTPYILPCRSAGVEIFLTMLQCFDV